MTQVRYYRINRTAYTAAELVLVSVGPRKLFLPFYLARWWFLRQLRMTVPIGEPIPDRSLLAKAGETEAEEIRSQLAFFEDAEAELIPLGFRQSCHLRNDDPRSPRESFSLYAIHDSEPFTCTCALTRRRDSIATWHEISSSLTDGRYVKTNDHGLAGRLRPPPSLVMFRVPGASLADLLAFHRSKLQELRSQDSQLVEKMALDEAIQADRDYYRGLIEHWIRTGLLVPEQAN